MRVNRGRKGAAATEMALLLPFLAFLFCVTVDYCRAFHASQVVESSARSGALYGSGAAGRDADAVTPEEAAKQAAVAEGATLRPPLREQDVVVTSGADGITVTVNHRFSLFTGYTGLSDGLTITRTVTMPVAPKTSGAR